MKLSPTEREIYEVLQNVPVLRSDDRKLIWHVFVLYGAVDGAHITADGNYEGGSINFDSFITTISTETIRRSRQKVQEMCPDVQAEGYVRHGRKIKEEKISEDMISRRGDL